MLGMGCAFLLQSLAESVSRNLSNSVIRGVSERRANDAKRKTYNENGVKTTLRTA